MSSLIVDFPRNSIPRHRLGTPDIDDRTPRTKPPSVRFSPRSTLHVYHEGPRDSTAGPDSSYSDEEKEAFKLRTREEIAVLRRMNDAGLGFDQMGAMFPDVSPVGLERYLVSPEVAKKQLITRRLVKLAVLTEQARCGDVTDAAEATDKQERIARASMKHSEWSVIQAQLIGSFQAMSRDARG